MSVKESWKKVGDDLGDICDDIANSQIGKDFTKFGKHLGQSMVVTIKAGVRTVSDWAREDNDVDPKESATADVNTTAE